MTFPTLIHRLRFLKNHRREAQDFLIKMGGGEGEGCINIGWLSTEGGVGTAFH